MRLALNSAWFPKLWQSNLTRRMRSSLQCLSRSKHLITRYRADLQHVHLQKLVFFKDYRITMIRSTLIASLTTSHPWSLDRNQWQLEAALSTNRQASSSALKRSLRIWRPKIVRHLQRVTVPRKHSLSVPSKSKIWTSLASCLVD